MTGVRLDTKSVSPRLHEPWLEPATTSEENPPFASSRDLLWEGKEKARGNGGLGLSALRSCNDELASSLDIPSSKVHMPWKLKEVSGKVYWQC